MCVILIARYGGVKDTHEWPEIFIVVEAISMLLILIRDGSIWSMIYYGWYHSSLHYSHDNPSQWNPLGYCHLQYTETYIPNESLLYCALETPE